MKLRCLGSGTSVPSLERSSSSYVVTLKRHRILIDIGPSVVRRLLEYGYKLNDIDIIMLTHFHVDHTADLSTFLFACNYGIEPRMEPLLIIGGPGVHTFYRRLARVYPWITPNNYELDIKSMSRDSVYLDDLCITTERMRHNRESIGIRMEEKKSITFSGDTDYTTRLERLAQGTDLLVVECSFPERKVKGHLNLPFLERLVAKANPKKVLISHLYPEWQLFRGVLQSPYLLAEDGMEIVV